ncbi:unnamed protein product [Rotaria sordida]|uniref:Uncharacterized protein n=1 Tax=Rotaria sordida TaxID=392033 RepID=A0A813W698_9BILA|nr:unnamed protein product [Rotaria sordida]CAF0848730.1 unnamed protein product [Rotaria sordida]CAF1015249.1 unnamed protein product [Rotaria sordida]CAF4065785.1 unnamed protein product [Rotaria sordida]
MSKFILFGLLFTFIISISADSCLYGNVPGKVCGLYPLTYCCPMNTECGSYTSRTCDRNSNGPGIIGIIFFVVIGLFIFIMVLRACIVCCSSRKGYYSLPSSDSTNLARSGAVVCTVAASHC